MDDVVYVGAIVQEANKIFIEEQTKEITTFCNHPGMENVLVVEESNLKNPHIMIHFYYETILHNCILIH